MFLSQQPTRAVNLQACALHHNIQRPRRLESDNQAIFWEIVMIVTDGSGRFDRG